MPRTYRKGHNGQIYARTRGAHDPGSLHRRQVEILVEHPLNLKFFFEFKYHHNMFLILFSTNAYMGDALQHSLFDRFSIRLRRSAWNSISRTSCVALFLIFASFVCKKAQFQNQDFPKFEKRGFRKFLGV